MLLSPVAISLTLSMVVTAVATTSQHAAQALKAQKAAQATAAENPLAGHPWGVYHGPADMAWNPYLHAGPAQKALLDKIVQVPKSQWFGSWIPDNQIAGKVTAYLDNVTGGDPNVLANMTIFRMQPWERAACNSLPTAAQQASFKRWISSAAAAIGDHYVALVLQPDGPFALCAPGGSQVPSHLLGYAARTFAANPNTSVYIDAGAADWLRSDPAKALQILKPADIAAVRGFELNSTHYDSTHDELAFGTAIVKALAAAGYPDKHFVVNTAANGVPFAGYSYHGPDFDNARVCRSRSDSVCVTLGIPPTSDVANPAWGLSAADNALATAYCDGYVWLGRPWLYRQAAPFVMKRALQLARTSAY
jgi:endoglucanase